MSSSDSVRRVLLLVDRQLFASRRSVAQRQLRVAFTDRARQPPPSPRARRVWQQVGDGLHCALQSSTLSRWTWINLTSSATDASQLRGHG